MVPGKVQTRPKGLIYKQQQKQRRLYLQSMGFSRGVQTQNDVRSGCLAMAIKIAAVDVDMNGRCRTCKDATDVVLLEEGVKQVRAGQ